MRKFNKRIISGLLAATMFFGINTIPAKAKAVSTGVHHSSGTYVLYVRESGSEKLLGKMTLSKDSSHVYNTFTADRDCKTTSVSVSQTNSSYKTNSTAGVKVNGSVLVSKSVSNPTYIYGYCTVNYD